MRRPPLLIGALLLVSSVARAATIDCGVAGKATVFDRLQSVGTAKINYRSTAVPCIQKGPAGSTDQVSGRFDILYVDQPGSVQGAFVMPAPWFLNVDTRAKFLNPDAPSGPSEARKVGIKAERLARFGSRGLGDTGAIDITNPPGPGGVLAILTVHNAVDGNTYRMCTKWTTGSGSRIRHEVIDGGLGRKLFLDHGVVASCSIVPPTTSTSTSVTSTTSTSLTTTTSTSLTTTTSTSTSTSTSTTLVLKFVTGPPTGSCGSVRIGGSTGTLRKALGCGGLNIGGGNSTVAEGPTPSGAETQFNAVGTAPTYVVTGRTAAQSGSSKNCSATGCQFGPWLPIINSGTSTCVQNTFGSPASGTLNSTAGTFTGSFPLSSQVYLTGNDVTPCPQCLSGKCDPTWVDSTFAPSPDANNACVAVNANGDTYDCRPSSSSILGSPFPVLLNPITTGTASKSNASGLFCNPQATAGAFGCKATSTTLCPGTGMPTYYAEVGVPSVPLSASPTAVTLASAFCIPSVGGIVDIAANLPGPGATSLPGTFALSP